jgi:hypothetical protein
MRHEILAKRNDMVTHQSVDSLLGTLGFSKKDIPPDVIAADEDANGEGTDANEST